MLRTHAHPCGFVQSAMQLSKGMGTSFIPASGLMTEDQINCPYGTSHRPTRSR